MNWRRSMGCGMLGTLLAFGMIYSSEPTKPTSPNQPPPLTMKAPDPEKDCPPGLVCFTPAEAAYMDKALAKLQAKLDEAALAKPRRFGFTIGCGTTVGPELNGGAGGLSSTLGCGAMWGFRFH